LCAVYLDEGPRAIVQGVFPWKGWAEKAARDLYFGQPPNERGACFVLKVGGKPDRHIPIEEASSKACYRIWLGGSGIVEAKGRANQRDPGVDDRPGSSRA